MATTLKLDDFLIDKAVELGGHRTKEAAVTQALEVYIALMERQGIVKLFGTVAYESGYDYKKQRQK